MQPLLKYCFLCEHEFLAEWAKTESIRAWHTSEICPACEQALRERAA
ncbi:hypothetical protein HY251_09760 [bacterium]|nr:hypothetical protein [bacterium]